MDIPALGRHVVLGMLYDAFQDKLLTDFKLSFKDNQKSIQPQISSTFEVASSNSTESKFSVMDVNESLKAGVLSGLIKVDKSARFLNEYKKFKNQSRVTLQYTSTTVFEKVLLTLDEIKGLLVEDDIKESGATHVVTGILYGANAFFVFDSKKLDGSSENIEDSMEAVVKKIATVGVDEKLPFELSDEEEAVILKCSCKYYGDLVLNKYPENFKDAVRTYSKLPELLGKNGENAVPVKVWLIPLKNLYPSAAELKGDLSNGLLRRFKNALEGLTEIDMKYNETLEKPVVEMFPQIRKKMQRFQRLCEEYTNMLKKTMREKIPLIRRKQDDERSVKKLLDDQEKSPFRQENLEKWLDDAEREIYVISFCHDLLKELRGIKFVPNESEFDKELRAEGVKGALCFVFTSLKPEDPYLDQMDAYLKADKTQPPARVTPPSDDQWFQSDKVFKKMKNDAKKLLRTSKIMSSLNIFHYFVTALPNNDLKGGSVYHYRNGKLKSTDF